MFNRIKIAIRKWIKRKFDLCDIDDLQIGAHCGLCGRWMPDIIIEKYWSWSMCDKCAKLGSK